MGNWILPFEAAPGPKALLFLRHYGSRKRWPDVPAWGQAPGLSAWASRKVLRSKPGVVWHNTGSVEHDIQYDCLRIE